VPGVGLAAPVGDERIRIWADSWRMLADGGVREWLVGHGIGSFPERFPAYSLVAYRNLTLPHNHAIELLFENGLLGAGPVMAVIVYLALRSVRLARGLLDTLWRRVAQANLATFGIWFAFSFLAFGFYSRYTLYPLGFLVGIYLTLADRLAAEAANPFAGDAVADGN
jgi:O-antigen ligase